MDQPEINFERIGIREQLPDLLLPYPNGVRTCASQALRNHIRDFQGAIEIEIAIVYGCILHDAFQSLRRIFAPGKSIDEQGRGDEHMPPRGIQLGMKCFHPVMARAAFSLFASAIFPCQRS
jgi:hypothetical protein